MATNSKGTAGRNFSTITAWEAAVDGALSEEEIGDCKDDSDFNEQVIVNGSSATSTNFINITADTKNRHRGFVGEGVKMDNLTPANNPIFEIRDGFTKLDGFLITGSGSDSGDEAAIGFGGGSGGAVVRYTIIYELPSGGGDVDGIKSLSGLSGQQSIYATIFYAIGRHGMIAAGNNATYRCAHVTIHGCGDVGFACGGGDISVENCISYNNTGSDYAELGSGNFFATNNNMSSDSTADEFGSDMIVDASGSGQFISVEPGEENFHLNPTASAKGAGNPIANLNSGKRDIDNQERRRFDMGADEERIEVRNYVLNFF